MLTHNFRYHKAFNNCFQFEIPLQRANIHSYAEMSEKERHIEENTVDFLLKSRNMPRLYNEVLSSSSFQYQRANGRLKNFPLLPETVSDMFIFIHVKQ